VQDRLDPGDRLERRTGLVGLQARRDRTQLVAHHLEPQLAGLVHDDEEQLVVMLGPAERPLEAEQLPEL
jgi:hypothetical protein